MESASHLVSVSPVLRRWSTGAGGAARPAVPPEAVFVGRDAELRELERELDEALAGYGRTTLLVGEAGVGKTCLAEGLAAGALERGAEVLVGRCHADEGAPPFWPWLQVLRAFADARATAALAQVLGPDAGVVAQMVPAIRARLTELPALAALDPARARFRLFDGVSAVLRRSAAERPIVVVLDDLHWADRASLLLLGFLAQEIATAPLLVVATYRGEEVARSHPLTATLADLARAPGGRAIRVGGLDAHAVGRFVALTTGHEPPDDLVVALHRRTGGNPLFVRESVRLLLDGGRLETAGIPDGIRAVIGRRLDHLSADAEAVLAVASVIGQEFDLALLARAAGLDGARLGAALEEAQDAGLVVAASGVGRRRFVHGLMRETVYEDLGTARRRTLHRRVAHALERLSADDPDARVDALAHHFFEGAALDEPVRVVEYAERAGELAMGRLAHHEAAAHYERALAVLRALEADDRRVCVTLLALGDAWSAAGDAPAAEASYARAAVFARAAGAPELLAAAALGFAGPVMKIGLVDPAVVDLLERALAALPATDGVLRARVLARLALELAYADVTERRDALIGDAMAMAYRVDDLQAMMRAMEAQRQSLLGARTLEGRLVEVSDLLQQAERAGDAELAMHARMWRFLDLVQFGRMEAADSEIDTLERMAEAMRHPLYLYRAVAYRAMRALMDGRFADAERLGREFLARGQRAAEHNAVTGFAVQVVTLARLRGRLDDVLPTIESFAAQYPSIHGWQAGVVTAWTERGRTAEARAVFETLAARDFEDLPWNNLRLVSLAHLAEACCAFGDARRARLLYDLFLPFDGWYVVVGGGIACYGPVARYLGMLAATMRDWERAERHLTEALVASERVGARPIAALVRRAHAAMLGARDRPGDRERARALEAAAAEAACALGMALVSHTEPALPAGPRRLFRDEGEYFVVGAETSPVTLKARRGLRYLALLLRHPGREWTATAVVAGADGRRVPMPAAGRDAERARVNVTAAIRDATRRIATHDKPLARHLATTIRTGTTCTYHPTQDDRVAWLF